MSEVTDPARAFLAEHDEPAPGSVVAPTLEGSRPILVEVQALVAPGAVGSPRRTASGVDPNRVALLIAVLGRRAGIGLASHDVYVNLAGGLSVGEPGPRPADRARPRLVAPRPAGQERNRRDRRGRAARRAAAGARASSGACARRRGSDSGGRSCRGAARGGSLSDGARHRDRRRRIAARGDRRGARTESAERVASAPARC